MIRITFIFLLVRNNLFFLEIFYLNFFGNVFVVYIFPWIWNQKKMLVGAGGGVIQLFKLKISPNYFYKGKM
jgi:hypothetical protein